MDILFKPQGRSNGTDGTKLHGHFFPSDMHMQSLYLVVISCLNFILRLKTQVEGA